VDIAKGIRERCRSDRVMPAFDRITIDPNQMGGVPCIRRLRIPVATVVGLVAEGRTVQQILGDYPDLEAEDIRQALQYAAEAVRERQLPLRAG
jgi:uncharacterized protein (DUF433 family)